MPQNRFPLLILALLALTVRLARADARADRVAVLLAQIEQRRALVQQRCGELERLRAPGRAVPIRCAAAWSAPATRSRRGGTRCGG